MKTRSILKKSIRSIVRNRGSYTACVIVLSLGILMFISVGSILAQVQNGIQSYYEEYRFGDAFATLQQGIPDNYIDKLKEIEGIREAEGTLTATYKANLGSSQEIIKIKLISAEPEVEKKINQYRYTGEPLKQKNDIWLGKAFYGAYGFENGDTVGLQVNGREALFTIKGTFESPEFITIMSDEAAFPDEKAYTVALVQNEALEGFTSQYGIVNELVFLLEEDVSFSDVEKALREKLSKYGLNSLIERKDQQSHFYITDEIAQMEALATILPAIFMFVSFIMLYIMLKRLIEQERGEIGAFKALGYKNQEIIVGYMLYGVAVSVLGFLLGLLISVPFGAQLYEVYQNMYSLPYPYFTLSWDICAGAFILSLAVSILSVFAGARSVLSIRPVDAMRARAPDIKGSKLNLDHFFFRMVLTKSGVMAIRNIERNKKRCLLVIFSIIAAFALTNVIYAFSRCANDILTTQTQTVQIYDIKAGLSGFRDSDNALGEIRRIDGVLDAEGMIILPVQMNQMNLKEDIAIYGLDRNSDLYKIMGIDGAYYQPPENGIMLSKRIAKKLQVGLNDAVEINSPYFRKEIKLYVTSLIEEAMGPGCYMNIETLSSLINGKEPVLNQILIKADAAKMGLIQEELAGFPMVTDIANKERIIEGNKTLLESFMTFIYALLIMAFLMGFGAIYNVSRISLAEKKRELATLRILGYRVDETAAINSFEQWLMLAVGIVVGFIPSYLLRDFVAEAFSTDYVILKPQISVQSVLAAVLCCILAVMLANAAAKREIKCYELVEVLRERE